MPRRASTVVLILHAKYPVSDHELFEKRCLYLLLIGLDASTARNVMQCLSDLSKQGRELTCFEIIMFR